MAKRNYNAYKSLLLFLVFLSAIYYWADSLKYTRISSTIYYKQLHDGPPANGFADGLSQKITFSVDKNDNTGENSAVHVVFNQQIMSAKSHQNQNQCVPRSSIGFLKTHKCGSSTMQNIILRYGDSHNLTFALPKLGNGEIDHMFTMDQPLKPQFVQKLPVSKYDILCHHCIFNKTAFDDIVKDGALIVTVIRSPVKVFESTFAYFEWAKQLALLNYTNPVLEFMKRAEVAGKEDLNYVSKRNPMLHEFGLLDNQDDELKINTIIDHLKSVIDFAVITDYYDESLILLKEKLCWDFDDIVYFPQLVRTDYHRNVLDQNLKHRIKRWNFGDVKLFEYFNQTLWKKIDEFGPDRMRKELKKFRERKSYWKDKCIDGDKISDIFISVKLKEGMEDNKVCWQMTRSEAAFTHHVREKQINKLGLAKENN